MRPVGKTWIGADPGGLRNFGLAILQPDGRTYTVCVNCADEAVAEVKRKIRSRPGGIGVDAPLWWSSGISSGRYADQWLRKTYGLSGGQVQAPNSLRGAALVQAMMFVQRLRELFPGVRVTETHPKAVLAALKVKSDSAFCRRFSVTREHTDHSEHERDAIVSAVAAREGFEGRWSKDLSTTRGEREQDPSTFWLAPVHYYWPAE